MKKLFYTLKLLLIGAIIGGVAMFYWHNVDFSPIDINTFDDVTVSVIHKTEEKLNAMAQGENLVPKLQEAIKKAQHELKDVKKYYRRANPYFIVGDVTSDNYMSASTNILEKIVSGEISNPGDLKSANFLHEYFLECSLKNKDVMFGPEAVAELTKPEKETTEAKKEEKAKATAKKKPKKIQQRKAETKTVAEKTPQKATK